MVNSIIYRLKRLESLTPDKLQILVERNGEVEEMTVEQFEEMGGTFIRVVNGANLQDLDRLLNVVIPDGNI